jgi:hypothetical protein
MHPLHLVQNFLSTQYPTRWWMTESVRAAIVLSG